MLKYLEQYFNSDFITLYQFAEHLQHFGVDIATDIVAVTGDGAPMMVAFGNLLKEKYGIPYLLCTNHTVHLAVTDSLFNQRVEDKAAAASASAPPPSHSDSESDSDSDSSDGSNVEHEENYGDEANGEVPAFMPATSYSATLDKMRDIIKIFRYSPKKAGIHEVIQKRDTGKTWKFVVAVATRWNSLVSSGKRFLQILPSTLKALPHKEIKSKIVWNDRDTEVLTEIVDILEPARVATVDLSKSNINLIVGEAILMFLFKEVASLKEQHATSSLIHTFSDALEDRIDERRHKLFTSLVLYLHNRESLRPGHPMGLAMKSAVIKLGVEMMGRLYKNEVPVIIQGDAQPTVAGSSLQERLKLSVGNMKAGASRPEAVGNAFKKEFDYFELHGIRGPLLNKFLEDLYSVQPTSTQSERNFSIAGAIATKKRSNISSKKLNASCFLHSYFINKDRNV